MKEAIVYKGPRVEIVDSNIPEPKAGQVIIKINTSGCNPKDWKVVDWDVIEPLNTGDDMAGTIHSVGDNVYEFKKGDRVIAFHEMGQPGGSFAEYGVAWAHTTAHLPPTVTFEQGATVPLAALTAVLGLYAPDRLALPQPWSQQTDSPSKTPLLIYGAGSAVGSYAIQLAIKSNIHPIIAVAGKAQAHVEAFIDRSKGDTIVDYRNGDDALIQDIRKALGGSKLEYAFDAVSSNSTPANIAQVLDAQTGKVTLVLPNVAKGMRALFDEYGPGVGQSLTLVGDVHEDQKDLGFVYLRYLCRGLAEGWFKAHPQEVIPGGLGGVQKALENLKDGKASATKYVFRISETDGSGNAE